MSVHQGSHRNSVKTIVLTDTTWLRVFFFKNVRCVTELVHQGRWFSCENLRSSFTDTWKRCICMVWISGNHNSWAVFFVHFCIIWISTISYFLFLVNLGWQCLSLVIHFSDTWRNQTSYGKRRPKRPTSKIFQTSTTYALHRITDKLTTCIMWLDCSYGRVLLQDYQWTSVFSHNAV